MFESVVPEVAVRPSRRVLYETLPVSLAVHAIAIFGVLTSSLWDVAFPSQSPRLTLAYSLTRLPDPPPPPPPPAPQPAAPKPQPQLTLPKAPPPQITQIVAPTVIPDFIPQVAPESEPAPPPPPQAPPAAAPAPVQAVAAGAPKSDALGAIGGKKFGTVGGIVFGDDGRVHVDRSEKLPLQEIEKEYPTYPEAARKNRLEDKVVVRYTVGINGRVIDLAIIEHAAHAMFEDETLRVIRNWRFRPMKINGKPVEVVHEVEFFYQFNQR